MDGVFFRDDDDYGHVIIGDKVVRVVGFEDSCKAMHGDSVVYDDALGKIVRVIRRNNQRLLGVLALSSKVSLGLTNKGIPKKRFSPLDKRYPAFAIATRRPMQSSDAYAIIQTDDWTDDKYPSGNLERIIGNIGDYDAERESIKIRYGINWKKFKFDVDKYLVDLTPDRHNLTDLHCFSIDPPGCKDIDDVLHFKRIDNDTIEIGIHIADVSSFVQVNTDLDIELRARGESVYIKDGQTNMMPDIMSTNHCSLIEGTPRRAFSVIIRLNNNLEKKDVKFIKSTIINKRSMTYDEAEETIMYGNDDDLKALYAIGNRLYDINYHKRVTLDAYKRYDTHMMVEIFMVMANVEVANMLVISSPGSAIIRSHKGLKADRNITLCDDDTDVSKAIQLMNRYKMERAVYTVYDGESSHHIGLGETCYTHFTSPIRRYFDITVHRLLWLAVNKGIGPYPVNLCDLCDHLNECHKRIGDAHRESARLDKVYDFYRDNPVMETIGYIVNISDRMLTIYVPNLDIDIEAKIVSDKLIHLIDYISTENEFKMTNIQTRNVMQLALLQKLDIRIIVSIKKPYVRRKLLVELLNPNPISFIMHTDVP